jgi:hypothetical protein
MMPCSPEEVHRCFQGTYCRHPQGKQPSSQLI